MYKYRAGFPISPEHERSIILKRVLAFIAVGCLAFLVYQPLKWLLVDWADIEAYGVRKLEQLELATRGSVIKDSSLRLICNSDGLLQLVLFTTLPIPPDFLPSEGSADNGGMYIHKQRTAEEIKSTDKFIFPLTRWFRADGMDAMVTPPIDDEQLTLLAKEFNQPSPFMVNFFFFKTITRLTSATDGKTIESLSERCLSHHRSA